MSLALTVNSHSSNKECIELYFRYLERYIGEQYFDCIYLFVDDENGINIPSYVKVVNYDSNLSFTKQTQNCLKQVKEDILLYSNEDYIFYANADLTIANFLVSFLENNEEWSFIKLVHSDVEKYREFSENFLIIDKHCENNFSQVLTLWNKEHLLKIHNEFPSHDHEATWGKTLES